MTQAEAQCKKELREFVTERATSFQGIGSPKIVLSHIPMREARANYHALKGEVLKVEPDYILSGHTHHQSYISHTVWEREGAVNRLTHEITVPTCSYRMGEEYMGAGVAVIGMSVQHTQLSCSVPLRALWKSTVH